MFPPLILLFPNLPPEDSYSVTRTFDGQPYFLSLTDTAGQEEYRGLWASSNLRSDAFLFVYDITSQSSLSALDYFVQMVDMECEHRHDSREVQPIKIVAGNKCDLKEARVVSSRQGLEYARSRNCGFMETSARDMVNIEETFARVPSKPKPFLNRPGISADHRSRCTPRGCCPPSARIRCRTHPSIRPDGSLHLAHATANPAERKR